MLKVLESFVESPEFEQDRANSTVGLEHEERFA